jgi:hypothetical protein
MGRLFFITLLPLLIGASSAWADDQIPAQDFTVRRIEKTGEVVPLPAHLSHEDNRSCIHVEFEDAEAKGFDVIGKASRGAFPFAIDGIKTFGCVTKSVTSLPIGHSKTSRFHYLIEIPAELLPVLARLRSRAAPKEVAVATPSPSPVPVVVATPTPEPVVIATPAPAETKNNCFSKMNFWLSGALTAGYTQNNSSFSNQVKTLQGSSISAQIAGQFRDLCFGELQIAYGFQESSISGSDVSRNQSISAGAPLIGLGYLHSLYFKNFYAGVLFNLLFGDGARLNVLGTNSSESMYLFGPQFLYRYPLNERWELSLGISPLFSLNLPNESLFEMPIRAGFQIHL